MGKVRDIIDKTFEYGQGRGELPGVNELAEAIEAVTDRGCYGCVKCKNEDDGWAKSGRIPPECEDVR